MFKDKIRTNIINFICICIIVIYFSAILIINFSQNPQIYCTDMYSDMTYAAEVWTHRSIFPDNWVFGNQLYVVATPVLAAVFYGLVNDHCIAMGLASSLMGIGTVLSFSWMLKPVFSSIRERLLAIAAFMSLILLCGGATCDLTGWQLFFTMCSYYACYAISVFLSFGCYLRSKSKWSPCFAAMLFAACLFSFGTGMQSLRQTAIMIMPMVAVEMLRKIHQIMHKEKLADKALLIVSLIAVSNLLGILVQKTLPVRQVEIFGALNFSGFSDILSNSIHSIINVFSLLHHVTMAQAAALTVLCLVIFVYLVVKIHANKNRNAAICLSLFVISILVILTIDIFTTMNVRDIYYFLLYPLIIFAAVVIYTYGKKLTRYGIAILLIITFVYNFNNKLLPDIPSADSDKGYTDVVDYLKSENIHTIFSGWNCGEKIGIASDWTIDVGFWNSHEIPFVPVKYLCDPSIFDVDASECAYLFNSEYSASVAEQRARDLNIDFTLEKYFSEYNLYIYTSSVTIFEYVPAAHS